MIKTFEVKVDVEKELYSPTDILFSVSRNDFDSIELLFEITQDDQAVDLTGKTVELAVLKPTGFAVYQDCIISSALEGKASVRLSQQAYVDFGIHIAELNIRDADQMVVTTPFSYKSREGILGTEEIESTNDWSALQKVLFLYDHKPILTEGAPTTVPEYVGQTALDTVNQVFYIANDLTATGWVGIIQTSGETTSVSWETILNKPLTFPSDPHTHSIADVLDLQSSLDAKADDVDLAGKSDVGHTHNFETEITNKPLTYPPDIHTHEIADVTNLQTALDGKMDDGDAYLKTETYNKTEVYNKAEVDAKTSDVTVEDNLTSTSTTNALSSNQGRILNESKAPVDHDHAIADVTGLQTALDGKADDGDLDGFDKKPIIGTTDPSTVVPEYIGQMYLNTTTNDAYISNGTTSGAFVLINQDVDWAEITGKPSTYPPDAHSHAIADVTDLQTALDGKVDDSEMAGKSDVGHLHTFAEITEKPATYPPDAHGHSIADVTDLQTTLDGLDRKPILGTTAPTTVVPEYVGQMYLDTSTNNAYISNGTTSGAFVLINSDEPVDWTEITGKPATFPPDVHSHAFADITDKPATYPPDVHTHDFATGITGKPATYPPDAHSHGWAEITDKPTTFTPPLSSVTEVGGHRVGNGLTMVGEYLTVREGAGINVSDTNYSVEIDRAQTDAWYVKNTAGQSLTMWKGTQSEYDAIATKDPNTLYFIV